MRDHARRIIAPALLVLVPLALLASCTGEPTLTTRGSSGSAGTGGTAGSTSASHDGSVPSTTTSSTSGELPGTNWTLASFGASTSGSVPARPAGEATLSFGDRGALTGSTGCNSFSGTYEASGRSLTITVGPTTKMACTEPGLQAQETALLRRLPEVASFTVDADRLTLLDRDRATLLTYDAGLGGLEGTSWQVIGVNNGKGAVQSSALTEHLSLSFEAGGALSGSDGCNTFGGSWTTSGRDGLTIELGETTLKGCAEDVTALATQYTTALGNVATYELDGSKLTLRAADGATQVTATLAPAPTGPTGPTGSTGSTATTATR